MKRRAILLICSGTALVLVAATRSLFVAAILRESVATEGTLVAYETVESDGDAIYYPVIECKLPDGRRVIARLHAGSSAKKHPIGASLPVRYSPSNPNDVYGPDYASVWGVSLAFGIVGFVLISTGVGLSALAARDRPASPRPLPGADQGSRV